MIRLRFQTTPSSQRKSNSECSNSFMPLFPGEVQRWVLPKEKGNNDKVIAFFLLESLPFLMENFGCPKISHRVVRYRGARENNPFSNPLPQMVSSYFIVKDVHTYSMRYVTHSQNMCKERALQTFGKQNSLLTPSLPLAIPPFLKSPN